MSTILLLICSNVFMTFAWYGHLKYGHSWPLWQVVTLVVFVVFAMTFLNERFAWNYMVAFSLLIAAAVFAFAIKPAAAHN